MFADWHMRKKEGRLLFSALVLAFLFLVLLRGSSAATYDKWVLPYENTSMGSYTIYPTITADWEMTSIKISGGADDMVVLSEGECESTLSYSICFLDTRFNISKGWGRFDPVKDRMIPELHITLEEKIPQLGFTQKIGKTQLLVEEEARVDVTISASADKGIQNVSYRQRIPDTITITDLGDMRLENGVLVWEWLNLQGEKSLSYKLKFNQQANATLEANLSGVYPTGAILSKSSKLVLKTIPDPNPITQKVSLSTQKPLLGETVTYTLTVANAEDKVNKVGNLVIYIPSYVSVIKKDSRLRQIGSRLLWEGDVSANGEQKFEILLRPERSGSHNLTSKLSNTFYSSLQSKNLNSSSSLTSKLDVSLKQLSPKISFLFDKKQVNASEQSNIRVYVSNPDPEAAFFDINSTMETSLFGAQAVFVERLSPGDEKQPYYIPFHAPSLNKDTNLIVNFYGTYRTEYYEIFRFNISKTLLIKKDPNYINITEARLNSTEADEEANANNSAQNNSTTSAGEVKPPQEIAKTEKENFVTRVINWFKRLFGGK